MPSRPYFLTLLLLATASCAEPEKRGDLAPGDAAIPRGADSEVPDSEMPDAGGPDAAAPLVAYPRLSAPVEVRIDGQGVPHLYAQNDLDLFFASGYQQATDRLFQMEYGRRQALGRTAEVVGEAGRKTDLQSRTFRFAALSTVSVQRMATERPADHNLLVAFVGGVNRRIREVLAGEAPLPEDFTRLGFQPEAWETQDPLAIGIRIQFGFSAQIEFDLLHTLLHRIVPADAMAVLPVLDSATGTFIVGAAEKGRAPHAERGAAGPRPTDADVRSLADALRDFREALGIGEGSNGWLVAGEHTDNGRPLLANDSHARLAAPNLMYSAHLSSAAAGGAFDVIGQAFVGVPGIHVGHNRNVAWGATTNFADTTDLWDVVVDGDSIVVAGEAQRLEVLTETIRVRGEGNQTTEEVLKVRYWPGVGVIVPETLLPVPRALVANGELLLTWPGFTASNELFGYLDLDRARNLDDFERAIDLQQTGMQNWMAASADGIRYRTHGSVPDRGPPEGRPRSNLILDGADASAWARSRAGFLSDRHLPRLQDADFIASANNDPWGHTADGDPLNDPFYFGSFYDPGFRSGRVVEVLTERLPRAAYTRAEAERTQTEVRSNLAARWRPRLAQARTLIATEAALTPFRGDAALDEALELLGNWDGQATLESTEASLFRLFLAHVGRDTLADELTILFEALDDAQPITMHAMTLLAHERDLGVLLDGDAAAVALVALQKAAAAWEARGRPRWAELHVAVFTTPDGQQTTVASPGEDSSLNVAQGRFWKDGALTEHCRSTAGAVYRMVTMFAEDGTPETTYAVPKGNDGQVEDWLAGRFQPLPFRRADVEAAAPLSREIRP